MSGVSSLFLHALIPIGPVLFTVFDGRGTRPDVDGGCCATVAIDLSCPVHCLDRRL